MKKPQTKICGFLIPYISAQRVHQETGKTIGRFIEEARLRYVHAAREHGLTQKEIARNLGFSPPLPFGTGITSKRRRREAAPAAFFAVSRLLCRSAKNNLAR